MFQVDENFHKLSKETKILKIEQYLPEIGNYNSFENYKKIRFFSDKGLGLEFSSTQEASISNVRNQGEGGGLRNSDFINKGPVKKIGQGEGRGQKRPPKFGHHLWKLP